MLLSLLTPNRRHVVLGGLAAALCLPQAAQAEDGGLGGVVADVLKNATYEAEAVLTAFPRNGHEAEADGVEDEGLEGWSHIGLDSTSFLGNDWVFGLGVEAVASTYRGAERGVFCRPRCRSESGRFVDLSRLTLTYLGDNVEILAGKDDVPFGVAEVYSPTDLYGWDNAANPLQTIDFGVWQLRADYYFGSDRLSGFILPVEEQSPGPAYHSRWAGGDGQSDFFTLQLPGVPPGTPVEIEDEMRGSSPADWGYLVQYSGTATGLDYFLSGYTGPGPYPVLKRPAPGTVKPYRQVRPRAMIASAGAALVEGAWKLYGEGLGYHALGDRDEDVVRTLVGAKYRETDLANRLGLAEIAPVVELSKEWRLDQQDSAFYVVASRDARPNPNNLILSLTVKVNDDWEVGGAYNRSLKERDALTSAYIRYQPTDNLWMALTGTEFHGRDDTQFGRYSRHDNLSAKVHYSF